MAIVQGTQNGPKDGEHFWHIEEIRPDLQRIGIVGLTALDPDDTARPTKGHNLGFSDSGYFFSVLPISRDFAHKIVREWNAIVAAAPESGARIAVDSSGLALIARDGLLEVFELNEYGKAWEFLLPNEDGAEEQ